MRRVVCWLVPALAAWSVLVASCGGEAKPSATAYLVLEVDTSTVSAGTADDAMKGVQEVVQRRSEGWGARVLHVKRQDTNQLALELSNITAEESRDLLGRTALLEFGEPERDEANDIVCQDSGGQRFTVPADASPAGDGQPRPTYVVADDHQNLTRCRGPADQTPRGSVVWRPPQAVGSDGTEKVLTGRFLQANAEVIVDPMGQPVVRLEFDSEGGYLFDQITARLVGLPMAIFLDNEIISAGTVLKRISAGAFVIQGLTEAQGRILVSQINAGAAPGSIRVIGSGEGPLP